MDANVDLGEMVMSYALTNDGEIIFLSEAGVTHWPTVLQCLYLTMACHIYTCVL